MPTTSIRLLERVRDAADQAAWERFVGLYAPLLLRWCRQAGLPTQEAPDVVQDVFATLVRQLPAFRYQPGRGSFRAWLKTITLRSAAAWREKRSRDANFQPIEPHLEPAACDVSLADEEHKALLIRRAFELMRRDFDRRTWEACWEHTVSGLSAAEVGRRLGMSEGAVYVAKSRVLRRLRDEFQGLIE